MYVRFGFSGRFLMPPPPDPDAWRICCGVATDGKRKLGIVETAGRLAEYEMLSLAMEATHWFVEAMGWFGVALCGRSRNAAHRFSEHPEKKLGRNRVAVGCLVSKA